MLKRQIRFTSTNSFFLFGARGTGKTSLLRERYSDRNNWFIDLLDPDLARQYMLQPNALLHEWQGLEYKPEWIILDEVQKTPGLLDLVHQMIVTQKQKFILSGSSARKLKRGASNLLAGRAFVYHLFPLTSNELGSGFSLAQALNWGTLPQLLEFKDSLDKREYLKAYTNTYIKEEILQEQIIRKLEPFQRFLPVAAQMAGRIINFSKIALEAGTSVPTIQSYFQILEDTLLGFLLPQFHESIRKRQKSAPKFYFFDGGVQRALMDELTIPLSPQTYQFGFAFEQFVINEIYRRQSYARKDYRLSYLQTGAGLEIDLVVERPGLKRALIEIKSKKTISEKDLNALLTLGKDVPNSQLYCLSMDPIPKKIDGVSCLPWQKGLEEI